MTDQRKWIALVTFERCEEEQDILPDWALGASGWMLAFAPNKAAARSSLIRDIESVGLRVVEIDQEREVADGEDIGKLDEHLEQNSRDIESECATVWGTIHGYKGQGEA